MTNIRYALLQTEGCSFSWPPWGHQLLHHCISSGLQMSLVSTSTTILPHTFNNIFVEHQKQAASSYSGWSAFRCCGGKNGRHSWSVRPIASLLLHARHLILHPSTIPSRCHLTLSTGSQYICVVMGCIDLEEKSASFGRYSGHTGPTLLQISLHFLQLLLALATLINTSLYHITTSLVDHYQWITVLMMYCAKLLDAILVSL